MPRLVLCADDFGFSEGVSRTIAGLARAGKLNATCCMTTIPGFTEDAALLADMPEGFEVGLHLTLTGEAPLTAMPVLAPEGRLPEINPLQAMARRGAVPLDEVAGEIAAQFECFEAVLGRPPAFVDGHQHSHALPGIREIVLAETARRAPRAWVRDCTDSLAGMLARPYRGKALASAFHSRGLRAAAARHGVVCNDGFAGHYGFSGDYTALFPAFLRRPGNFHLVMCHPGAGRRAGDGIAAARLVEAEALDHLPIAALAAQQGLAFPR